MIKSNSHSVETCFKNSSKENPINRFSYTRGIHKMIFYFFAAALASVLALASALGAVLALASVLAGIVKNYGIN
jgi:hypothetical protein